MRERKLQPKIARGKYSDAFLHSVNRHDVPAGVRRDRLGQPQQTAV